MERIVPAPCLAGQLQRKYSDQAMINRNFSIALAILLGLIFVPGCGTTEPDPGHPGQSVLLITIDTLRADHLSCYGYPEETSPGIDQFLAGGTRFHHAYATSSRTAPSHVSLMTGLYPSFTTVDVENGQFPLNAEVITLAEIAREAGLRTAAVVSNPVLGRRLNLHQGFEIYNDTFPRAVAGRGQRERIAEDAVDAALELIRKFSKERFFIWIHIQDPHGPYDAPGYHGNRPDSDGDDGPLLPPGEDHSGYRAIPRYQLLGSELRLTEYIRRYEDEIRYFDRHMGRLFGFMEQKGLLENTLVAFTADHGEAFGEDEFYCAHGHGSGLDQTRVPLGFVGPGVASGVTLTEAVSAVDVFATLLEALGLDGPDDTQSRSLLTAMISGDEPEARVGFTESATQRAAFSGSRYLRRDRHPLDDHEFWGSANPYTGAPYIPLGQIRFTPLGGSSMDEEGFGSPEDLPPDLRQLHLELELFSARADQASADLAPLRQNRYETPVSKDEQQQLQALGYME